jgi:CheY-like chemotaxis protein/HPt (histidine-containing phosphotransfer) domain-containing protein
LILLSSVGQPLTAVDTEGVLSAVLWKPLRLSQLRDRLLEALGGMLGSPVAEGEERSSEDTGSAIPLRILLVEDNPVNQKVASQLLDRLGHMPDVSGNGREAIERLEREAYDVILMDVQMPKMDGLEASREICARWPAGQRPRIVAMTAEAMEGDREKCLAAGMEDYLVKPVTLDQLSAALAKCRPLGHRTAEAEVTAGHQPLETAGAAADGALDRAVLDQLREDLGGAATVHDVISTFLENTPAVIGELHEAAARTDADGIWKAAHKIKGTSAMLGAERLSQLCGEIEILGRSGTVSDATNRVTAIEAAYKTVEEALNAEVAKSPASRGS